MLVIALLMVPSFVAGVARADVAGTGTFVVQYNVTVGPTFGQTQGTVTFDDEDRVILGGELVNLGQEVGGLNLVSGFATESSGSPPSGSVEATYTSPALEFSLDGDYVCSGSAGCDDSGSGFTASFVADVFGISGSVLPTGPGVAYTSDGYASCSNSQHPITLEVFTTCTGNLAINVFGSVNTPASPDPVQVPAEATYLDPITGAEVTVSVEVQYEAVDTAGETTVVATSNEPGDIPANFATQVGEPPDAYLAAFTNISTSAVYQSPIRVCTDYPDDDGDGVIDGTEGLPQPIDECQMSMLHRPSPTLSDPDPPFADVTLWTNDQNCPDIDRANRCEGIGQARCIDRAANRICGEVDGFSPFVVAVDLTPPPFEVRIDAPKALNPFSRGNVQVKLLGEPNFDVSEVDVETLAFGPHGAGLVHDLGDPMALADHTQDLDGDGVPDLVLHFAVPETGIAKGDTEACLIGALQKRLPFEGCDKIATQTPSRRCGAGFAQVILLVPALAGLRLVSRRRRRQA